MIELNGGGHLCNVSDLRLWFFVMFFLFNCSKWKSGNS